MMVRKISRTTPGSFSIYFQKRLPVLLLSLLLHLNPAVAYSLKNCTVDFSKNPLDDVFVDCSNRKLASVPDDIPTEVTSVKLINNLLVKINREDFENLSKLVMLDLHLNQIVLVEERSFTHLRALTILNLSDNQLSNLTANWFQGLSHLTTLVLSSNPIEFIDTWAFRLMTNLQTVMLDNTLLQQTLYIESILQLPNVKELSLKKNLFTSFETKHLYNVSSGLKVLRVSGVRMEVFSITTPVFPHLETIDLTGFEKVGILKWDIPDKTLLRNITQLFFSKSSIPFQEFHKVLESLDSLMDLRLKDMDELINKGLLASICKKPTLRRLDLFLNSFNNLSRELGTCSQLEELNLSVHMTELSEGSIRSMKRLRSLNVEHNLLTKVPDDIRSLGSLKILNLRHNQISELGCDDLINTTRLTELYLTANHLDKLPSCAFEHLNHLNVLDISDNQLSSLGNAFKLGPKMLTFLDLSNNNIFVFANLTFQGLVSLKCLNVVTKQKVVVEKAFDRLKDLESLSISSPFDMFYNFTRLEKLKNLTVFVNIEDSLIQSDPNDLKTNVFSNLKSLKAFTVTYRGDDMGYLIEITPFLRSMTYLEDFKAVNIYISKLDVGTFHFNTHLKNLTITHSDLSGLDPELFLSVPNLEVLDFSYSKIRSLDFLAQANLCALRYLILRGNELTVISETVFQTLPALTYLDLNKNLFSCDCSNARFIQWVLSYNQTQVVNAHQYTCFFPVAGKGRKLLDFDAKSCWVDVSFICFIFSSGLVLLTLFFSLVHHFLRWRLAYVYYFFIASVSNKRQKKKEVSPHQFDAFVSYNVHDEAWVYRELLPVLEEEQGWRLCLHHRDFQPGKPIMENIADAIYNSRKTICVISWHYLQSEWCSREIQMASFRLFDEQKDVLILLFLEDIPAQQLSPYYRMRKLVKRRTYLSWPQAGQHKGVFWQNVSRALETGDGPADTDLLTGPAEL